VRLDRTDLFSEEEKKEGIGQGFLS